MDEYVFRIIFDAVNEYVYTFDLPEGYRGPSLYTVADKYFHEWYDDYLKSVWKKTCE